MSCTVIAVPYALGWIVNTFIIGSAITTGATIIGAEKYAEKELETGLGYEGNVNNNFDNICDDTKIISEVDFVEKSFETPFIDKELLLKTLEEHGCININEEWGQIRGEIENYYLTFEKMEEDKPYFLKISSLQKNNHEEKLNDLASEYALNVQEESYLSIIEKLKENNMEIEDEEVLDDNTIVLTINLEG